MAGINLSEENIINVNLTPESTIETDLTPDSAIKTEVPDINYIPGYKVAEEERRSNEIERQAYYEEIQRKVNNGEFNGEQGPQGPAGKDGVLTFEEFTEEQKASLKGDKGDKGDTGPQGPKGDKGDTGSTGPQGIQGIQGPRGLQGEKGDKGDTGNTGATGPRGATGPQGEKGERGEQGIQGPKGDTGATGPAGKDGTNGTNGKDGVDGKDGVTPTLKVGTTTTGEAGTNANVTMNQNGTEYTLNFTIPKGKDGTGGSGGDVDLSEYAKKTEIPTKTSQLTNDSKYITNNITTDFNLDGKLYLNTVGSSVNANDSSRIVFGTSSQIYSWIASNTSGAFSFSKGSGNIVVYPKTAQYNCIMSDCASDLGRVDKLWNNLYMSGVLSDGTNSIAIKNIANKSSIPTKTSQLTNDSGFLTSHQSLNNYYTKAEVEALFNSITNGNEVSY